MIKRPLGGSGIQVAPLAFGGNVFGWTVDEPTSFTLLDAFVAGGFDLIDTADIYSRWVPGHVGGESETIIGRWLKQSGKRSQVVLATKCGSEMGPQDKGLSAAYIVRAVELSLTRLQTDRIDLYQAHVDDLQTPQEETLAAFDSLIRSGKVRAIGASNFSGARLASSLETSRAQGLARYQTLQPHYNLYERAEFERDLEPVCRASGVGVIPYFSLAKGFLTGKYRSEADLAKSVRGSGVKGYLDPRGFRILAALDAQAKRLQSRPATVALAWLLSRPTVTAPIASATSLPQLDQLLRVGRLELDRVAIEELDAASGAD
ncbi:MAG: aldo/keto reductase [Planctomycetes bacterium]|nr:aldo/keto reductase [Planctomycetota bacterium]